MENKKINLFNYIIDTNNFEDIKTSELIALGFISSEIKKLVDEKYIIRTKRGHYAINDYLLLYNCAKELKKSNNYLSTKKCLEKCIEIDKTIPLAYIRLLIHYLYNNQESDFLNCFDMFFKNAVVYNCDKNLFLFLVGNIMELPDEYKKICKNLKLDDILVQRNNDKYTNIEKENEIRRRIYNGYFKSGYNYEKTKEATSDNYNIFQSLTKNLLNRSINAQDKYNDKVITLIREENFYSLIELFSKKKKQLKISVKEKIILKIIDDIQTIRRTQKIPEVIGNSSNLYNAIFNNDYYLANIYYEESNYKDEGIIILLKKMIFEISKIKENSIKSEIKRNPIDTDLINLLIKKSSYKDITYKDFINIGYNEYQINKLLRLGSISRVKRGHYEIIDSKIISKFNEELSASTKNGDISYYIENFEKENNIESLFNIIAYYLKNKDYETATKYFEILYNQKTIEDYDKNLMLYLYANIAPLSQKYMQKYFYLTLSDLENHNADKTVENVIKYIYQKKYNIAYKLLQYTKINNQNFVKFLLKETIDSKNKYEAEIREYIKYEDYDALIDLINKKCNKFEITKKEEMLLILLKDAIKIVETKQIPELKDQKSSDLYSAIKNKDYEMALKYSSEGNDEINSLIRQIIEKIEEVKKDNTNLRHLLSTDNQKISNEYESFVQEKCEEVIETGDIVLLKPMSDEEIAAVHNIVSKYYDLISFTINDNGDKRIVIRPYEFKYINYKDTILSASNAYQNEDYKTALEKNKQLLASKSPNYKTYFSIGLCYYKMYEEDITNIELLEKTLDYLIVSESLAKELGKNANVSGLISRLKKDLYYQKYSIANFEEISRFAIEKSLTFDQICIQFKLNTDRRNELALIYAKEAYKAGNYEIGDLYLSFVEKSKKTKFIENELDKIKSNKSSYISTSKKLTPIPNLPFMKE